MLCIQPEVTARLYVSEYTRIFPLIFDGFIQFRFLPSLFFFLRCSASQLFKLTMVVSQLEYIALLAHLPLARSMIEPITPEQAATSITPTPAPSPSPGLPPPSAESFTSPISVGKGHRKVRGRGVVPTRVTGSLTKPSVLKLLQGQAHCQGLFFTISMSPDFTNIRLSAKCLPSLKCISRSTKVARRELDKFAGLYNVKTGGEFCWVITNPIKGVVCSGGTSPEFIEIMLSQCQKNLFKKQARRLLNKRTEGCSGALPIDLPDLPQIPSEMKGSAMSLLINFTAFASKRGQYKIGPPAPFWLPVRSFAL
jgi:hypothetical protein